MKVKLYLYVFKRVKELQQGPMTDRDKYFVYAESQEQAFAKYKQQNADLVAKGHEPEFIGREPRW